MSELLKTYFERDLSLSELDELGALIAASPEAALSLQENARAFYLGLGLPEPEPQRKWGGWFLGSATGILLLGGLAAWQGSGKNSQERPALGSESEEFQVVSAVKPGAQTVPQDAAGETGDYLSVVVMRKRPGQVSVRILDANGAEKRRLFDGRLEGGSWNFKWDGMLPGGIRAPAGAYVIEVHEDGHTRSKRVRMGAAN